MFSSGMPVDGSRSATSRGICPASASARCRVRVRSRGQVDQYSLAGRQGSSPGEEGEAADVRRPEEGGGPHPVHLQVVGVAVAAEGVVGGDHLGPVPADEPDQALHRLQVVGPAEGVGVAVLGGALHPRVPVAEHLHLAHPQDGAGGPQLRLAHLAQAGRSDSGASWLWISPTSPRVAVTTTTCSPASA